MVMLSFCRKYKLEKHISILLSIFNFLFVLINHMHGVFYEVFYRVFQMVFFYKVYTGYTGELYILQTLLQGIVQGIV